VRSKNHSAKQKTKNKTKKQKKSGCRMLGENHKKKLLEEEWTELWLRVLLLIATA
jgi:hypothetical protein